jgi:putative ABC transport system permease protein
VDDRGRSDQGRTSRGGDARDQARSLHVSPAGSASNQTLLVRTAGEPTAIVPAIRRELQAIDSQLPIFAVTTLERELAKTLNQPRFQAVLFAAFAAIVLLLAATGIYGVTSHAVGQRTQEVGIRMAMGAARRDVLRLIVFQHLRPALVGLAVGVVGAVVLSRFLRTLLFGVSATDPATFVIVAGVLLSVAAAACWVPARRATRVDRWWRCGRSSRRIRRSA